MKCLSLKQPYADLMAIGRKTIELRKWNTKFKGEFLIHASKNIDNDACMYHNIETKSLILGAIIGKATLFDVKRYSNREEFNDDEGKHLATKDFSNYRYGFMVKDAIKFDKSIQTPGKLGLFEVDLNK